MSKRNTGRRACPWNPLSEPWKQDPTAFVFRRDFGPYELTIDVIDPQDRGQESGAALATIPMLIDGQTVQAQVFYRRFINEQAQVVAEEMIAACREDAAYRRVRVPSKP